MVRKNKLQRQDFDQLALDLNIKEKVRDYIYKKFQKESSKWPSIIEKSFSSKKKARAS